ncbi:hypothetical protein BDV59DRAFT_183629, partial [Aspergillus ambiguus]|uniref:uncharacterized protein n=1 Tax=Aspergillus ambiguus TaxID=176160 RepID=UPI003CCD024B
MDSPFLAYHKGLSPEDCGVIDGFAHDPQQLLHLTLRISDSFDSWSGHRSKECHLVSFLSQKTNNSTIRKKPPNRLQVYPSRPRGLTKQGKCTRHLCPCFSSRGSGVGSPSPSSPFPSGSCSQQRSYDDVSLPSFWELSVLTADGDIFCVVL